MAATICSIAIPECRKQHDPKGIRVDGPAAAVGLWRFQHDTSRKIAFSTALRFTGTYFLHVQYLFVASVSFYIGSRSRSVVRFI